MCKKHISDGQFERSYVNELLGLEKKRQLVTGAFPDKIQEQNSSIKVILALQYYSAKHKSRILSFICSLVNIEINMYSTSPIV